MTDPRPNRRRRVHRAMRSIAVLLALWFLGSWAVAYRLTHRNRRPFPENPPVVAWGVYQSHRLHTQDGHQIGAWYAPGRDDPASVLIIHGNKGSRRNCLDRGELLGKAGYTVLLISLRAHGDSSGELNDMGLSARQDVLAAVSFLEGQRPGRPVVVLGTSLGAAAAVFAAGELGHRVQGYILESPFQNLRIAVRNRTENELPPVFDWIAYHSLLVVSPLVLPDLDQISPHNAIANIPDDVPVLILAGSEDVHARPAEVEALFARVRTHGALEMFEGVAHLRMLDGDPARYRRVVLDFIARAGGGKQPVVAPLTSPPPSA